MIFTSKKQKSIAILLCWIGIIGINGLHRFYMKKWRSGLLYLFTFGLFMIGTIVDLFILYNAKIIDSAKNSNEDDSNNNGRNKKENLKEKNKNEIELKKNLINTRLDAIMRSVDLAKKYLIVKSKIKVLDELVQKLFDKTITNIQKIKNKDSDEWIMIDTYINIMEKNIHEIIESDKRIAEYYKSNEFNQIVNICKCLTNSRKEFNEYINKKSQSINELFGKRIIRNETSHNDVYNYVRIYKKTITPFTAEVSSNIFGSAENNPIEYIIKYFYPDRNLYSIQIEKLRILIEDLETLKEAQLIINNYKKDYDQYITKVPDYVLKEDKEGFYSRLGLVIINEDVLNVEYKFIYTSDGGMAQRSFTFPMNEENIIKLIQALQSKLSSEFIVKEQRSLMTTKLRTKIKERDNYTCCECGNSVNIEPNLLLEIDHIIPISKGGLTVESNLQTLCWKCNRNKGAKLQI